MKEVPPQMIEVARTLGASAELHAIQRSPGILAASARRGVRWSQDQPILGTNLFSFWTAHHTPGTYTIPHSKTVGWSRQYGPPAPTPPPAQQQRSAAPHAYRRSPDIYKVGSATVGWSQDQPILHRQARWWVSKNFLLFGSGPPFTLQPFVVPNVGFHWPGLSRSWWVTGPTNLHLRTCRWWVSLTNLLSAYNGAKATGPVYLDRKQIVSLTFGQRLHASTAAIPATARLYDCTSQRVRIDGTPLRLHVSATARLSDCTSLRIRIDCTPPRLHVSTTARL